MSTYVAHLLTKDVPNTAYDGRQRSGKWQKDKVFPAGTRVLIETQRFADGVQSQRWHVGGLAYDRRMYSHEARDIGLHEALSEPVELTDRERVYAVLDGYDGISTDVLVKLLPVIGVPALKDAVAAVLVETA